LQTCSEAQILESFPSWNSILRTLLMSNLRMYLR